MKDGADFAYERKKENRFIPFDKQVNKNKQNSTLATLDVFFDLVTEFRGKGRKHEDMHLGHLGRQGSS